MTALNQATLQTIVAEQLDGYHLVETASSEVRDEYTKPHALKVLQINLDDLASKYVRAPRKDASGDRSARLLVRRTRLVATEREDCTDSSAPRWRGAVVSINGNVVAVEG